MQPLDSGIGGALVGKKISELGRSLLHDAKYFSKNRIESNRFGSACCRFTSIAAKSTGQ